MLVGGTSDTKTNKSLQKGNNNNNNNKNGYIFIII